MGLITYVIRRVIFIIPVLIGVTALIFAITLLFSPEIRASIYMRDLRAASDVERRTIIEETINAYGLRDPFYKQYFTWVGQVLQGNLGWSMVDNRAVIESLINRFPATLEIVIYSAPFIVFLGIFLGVQSAVHRDKWIDHITRGVSIMGWSLPSFWLGILLLAIFYLYFGVSVFSPGRLSGQVQSYVSSGMYVGDTNVRFFEKYTGLNTFDGILNGIRALILPKTIVLNGTVVDPQSARFVTINHETATYEAITHINITYATITDAIKEDGTLANLTVPAGTIINGTITEGNVINGTVADGMISNRPITSGSITFVVPEFGMTFINGKSTYQTITDGTVFNGTIIDKTIVKENVAGTFGVAYDAFGHLLLPVIVLIVIQCALLIRVMRSSMLESLSKPYIIAAKAKGLTNKEVINKHARRNALIPVVTLSGLLVGGMLTGLTITETVFGLGGLGNWAAQAAIGIGGGPDVPAVLGFAMFSAIVFVVANLIVDILYAYIDPRIRLA